LSIRTRYLVLLLLVYLFPGAAPAAAAAPPPYAVAVDFVPVLNTPDFRAVFGGRDGRTLAADRCGQLRALEFIAFPGTVFRVRNVLDGAYGPVYRVTTDDYPYPSAGGYYIDVRLVLGTDLLPPSRPRTLPGRSALLRKLSSAAGSAYVWGGNVRAGLPSLLSLYPPSSSRPDPKTEALWTLRGLDCSGLLYEATNGYTPRNTSSLVRYGSPVRIEGLSVEEIVRRVRPLDLIVWKGHVMIVFDGGRIIESRLDCGGTGGGVVFRGLEETLRELCGKRVPLDEYRDDAGRGRGGFVIRRWYPEGETAGVTSSRLCRTISSCGRGCFSPVRSPRRSC